MRKGLLLYNPKSGDQSIKNRLDYIIGRFQEKNVMLQPYRLFIGKEDEGNVIEAVSGNNYDFVIASGGDGSVNYVVNILMRNNIHLPVGIFPSGTCNDFARGLGIGERLDDWIDVVLSRSILEVDLGLINEEQYFVGSLAGGLFADVSFNTHNELKRNFGPFAYYLKALSEVTHMETFDVKLKTETQVIEEKLLIFVVLNGTNAGGFNNLVKDADLTDGMMDILLIKSCSHIDLANLFFKVLSNEFTGDKHVTKLKAKECSIEASKNIDVSLDGEQGPGLPMNIRFINRGLKVFV